MKFSSAKEAAVYLIEILNLRGGTHTSEIYRGGRWVTISLEAGDPRISQALNGCVASANECLAVVHPDLRVG